MPSQQHLLTTIGRAQRCGRHAAMTGLVAGRKLYSTELRAPLQGQRCNGASLAATAAGFTGLVLMLQDPVSAKTPDAHQEVYVWGRREAIPGGAEADVLRPAKIDWFEQHPKGWVRIALGPSFGVAVDRAGQLYVWGEGRPAEADDSVFIGPTVVRLKGDAKGLRFEDVQCSSTAIYLLTRHGRTYMVENVPKRITQEAEKQVGSDPASSSTASPALELQTTLVPGLPSPGWFGSKAIKQMAIGLEHAAFVTRNGEVYCVGGNSWGQCGEKPEKQKGPMGALEDREHTEVTTPVRVAFPEGAGPIRSVAVGGRHTIAQDESGTLYSFGDDRRIQLGLGDTRSLGNDERHSYGILQAVEAKAVTTKKTMVRSVGYRYYQAHMQWKPKDTQPPLATNRPAYPPASLFACGEDFTIAVHRDSPDWYAKDQETNVAFGCGENSEGQCGRSFQQQQQVWLQARLPKRCRTTHLACGQGHCLALLASGELFGWGANQQGQIGSGSRAPACPPVPIKLFEEPPPKEEEGASEDVTTNSSASMEPRYSVTSFSCGFRNSAVICEVPSEP